MGGVPGSGKTTLARQIGDALHLPVVHRDLVKTGIHHAHGSTDPAEQKRFASAAFDAAFAATRTLIDAGSSVVLEAAFHRAHSGPPIRAVAEGTRLRVVWTRCPAAVALDRYRARSVRGERHPAHDDPSVIAAMEAGDLDWGTYDPPGGLPVDLVVDTAEGLDPDLAAIVAALEA